MAKGSGGSNTSRMIVEDGVMAWFDGPEWDELAQSAFEDAADEILGAAQRDAIWADRTGEARAGLTVEVENDNGIIILTLFHTVEYGLWLEVIQNGRFSVIMPTLDKYGSKVMRNAEAKIAKGRRGR